MIDDNDRCTMYTLLDISNNFLKVSDYRSFEEFIYRITLERKNETRMNDT